MPRFAANLSMMFNEWPFLDRFQAAADAGFEAVEYLFPYEFPAEEIGKRLQQHRLTQALFNLPPGDFSRGERGLAAMAGRQGEFRAAVQTALPYVEATGVTLVHAMAGLVPSDDAAAMAVYEDNLRHAVEVLGPRGVTVLIEPINRRGIPGYFLNDFGMATALIARLGLPGLRLQFDIFHRQIIHGDVVMGLRELLPISPHIQIASVPSRNEPDGEELSYPFLFAELDRLGYGGFVGCEYIPRGKTLDGLGWFTPYRR